MLSNRQNSKSTGYTASTKTLAVVQRLIQQGAVLVQSARSAIRLKKWQYKYLQTF